MKCTFEEHGDCGLRFDDLDYGADFIFINSARYSDGQPAKKLGSNKYIYYNRKDINEGDENILSEKVAKIIPSSPVVFVLDNEGQS